MPVEPPNYEKEVRSRWEKNTKKVADDLQNREPYIEKKFKLLQINFLFESKMQERKL